MSSSRCRQPASSPRHQGPWPKSRGGEFVALPSNVQLQLTVESVTPIAGQRSRHFRPQLGQMLGVAFGGDKFGEPHGYT